MVQIYKRTGILRVKRYVFYHRHYPCCPDSYVSVCCCLTLLPSCRRSVDSYLYGRWEAIVRVAHSPKAGEYAAYSVRCWHARKVIASRLTLCLFTRARL